MDYTELFSKDIGHDERARECYKLICDFLSYAKLYYHEDVCERP